MSQPTHDTHGDQRPERDEIRFAVVLNGGVSLAVWIGGVTLEIDRLTRRDRVYGQLLDLLDLDARADVITGTSAGGINGAALALAQVNETADLRRLRKLWAEQGRMETLLRAPFRGQPSSLLQGDEYFLPALERALEQLTADPQIVGADRRPVHLGVTATILDGVRQLQSDSLGQALPQEMHGGLMTFRHLDDPGQTDDFAPAALPATVRRLALAARTSASFPVAFEPSFLPVGVGAPLRTRPDLTSVASWYDEFGPADQSRYALDGGAMMNTPTLPALQAIEDMPAAGDVRRVMLLVFPHAPVDFEKPASDPADPPTVIESLLGASHATRNEAGRTHVETIERHNRRAGERRAARADVLVSLQEHEGGVVEQVDRLAADLFGYYRELRERRGPRDLALRPPKASPGWSYDRVCAAAARAQDVVAPPPYLAAGATWTFDAGGGWPWGVTAAEHVVADARDLARRMIRLAEGRDTVAFHRQALFAVGQTLRETRRAFDAVWATPAFAELQPSTSYWIAWLRAYERAFVGRADLTVADVAQVEGQPGKEPPDLQHLVAAINGACGQGALGARIVHLMEHVAEALTAFRPLLPTAVQAATGDEQRILMAWRDLLADEPDTATLITRLIRLDVVSTCLSTAPENGSDDVIELVQVSLQTRNAFARVTTNAGDKLGGARLSRFAGFLKESWRINDWMWGRLDAATMLCRVLAQPDRLRSARQAAGRSTRWPPTAEEWVDQWIALLFPTAAPGSGFSRVRADAIAEMDRYVYGDEPDLPPTLEAVADLFAWAIQADVVAEDLPSLRSAVLADRRDGAIQNSSGERLVEDQKDLLDRLQQLPPLPLAGIERDGDMTLDPLLGDRRMLGALGLVAFDEAGVGREPLDKEASGDLMIRTGVSAIAVGVTVLDSPKLGVPQAKPLTRLLRGFALLPYWAARGLTSNGRIAQSAALTVLALGAAMLALSLVLPATPRWVALIGLSSALFVFALAALRTGSFLHGVVMLGVVVPLATYAVADQLQPGGRDVGTVAVLPFVLLLVVGLMVLGSLPGQLRSPFAVVVDREYDPGRRALADVVVGLVLVLGSVLMAKALADAGRVAWLAGLVVSVAYALLGFYAYKQTVVFRVRYVGELPSRWPQDQRPVPGGVAAAMLTPALLIVIAAFRDRLAMGLVIALAALGAGVAVMLLVQPASRSWIVRQAGRLRSGTEATPGGWRTARVVHPAIIATTWARASTAPATPTSAPCSPWSPLRTTSTRCTTTRR